jgi:outer membrane receptor protein involved in Fe transport
VYSAHGFYASATGIYGSGLITDDTTNSAQGTGLLDFNKLHHVSPNFVLNGSAGYAFAFGGVVVRPQVYVENVFDKQYLLKGAFFSGASFGRPRSVQLRVNIGA